jgi:vacuolar-type H+-ATPase catalytic subunit A/Vma1
MNEIELQKKKQRGIRARQLLDDELIRSAFNDIKENIYQKIGSSSYDQSKEREDCYMMLRAVESFEGQFKKHINEGRAAEEKLSLVGKVVKRIQEL